MNVEANEILDNPKPANDWQPDPVAVAGLKSASVVLDSVADLQLPKAQSVDLIAHVVELLSLMLERISGETE
jgi:hypothetical protein